ncbi:hypothetical protein DID76_00820 [Candidatus Marinamargulisbacteria bacterium SCGC AG-414-C22]|nr:hypothetical protein DID76_00820 [Candidatus Marinamargulisbacteria bacterium SCGC AG-414-C22]
MSLQAALPGIYNSQKHINFQANQFVQDVMRTAENNIRFKSLTLTPIERDQKSSNLVFKTPHESLFYKIYPYPTFSSLESKYPDHIIKIQLVQDIAKILGDESIHPSHYLAIPYHDLQPSIKATISEKAPHLKGSHIFIVGQKSIKNSYPDILENLSIDEKELASSLGNSEKVLKSLLTAIITQQWDLGVQNYGINTRNYDICSFDYDACLPGYEFVKDSEDNLRFTINSVLLTLKSNEGQPIYNKTLPTNIVEKLRLLTSQPSLDQLSKNFPVDFIPGTHLIEKLKQLNTLLNPKPDQANPTKTITLYTVLSCFHTSFCEYLKVIDHNIKLQNVRSSAVQYLMEDIDGGLFYLMEEVGNENLPPNNFTDKVRADSPPIADCL